MTSREWWWHWRCVNFDGFCRGSCKWTQAGDNVVGCIADFGPWGAWRAVIADVVALHDEFGDDPDPFVPLLLWMDFWRLLHDTVGWRPSP